jgi:L-ascorbate metabolism protein UlaG (beta-lactamase superfamily)
MKLTYYGHSCFGVEIKGKKILAADFIDCKTIVGVHYNTFGFIKINETEAKETFSAAGKTLLLPAITETIDI